MATNDPLGTSFAYLPVGCLAGPAEETAIFTFASKKVIGFAVIGAAAVLASRAVVRRTRRFDFRGSTVLITGGSRGLGLILARRLVEVGASVAICAREQDELNRACADIRGHGDHSQVLGLVCDVTDVESLQQTVEAVRGRLGEIDVLINNAGVIVVGPHDEMAEEDYRQAMDVHLWGPLRATRAVLQSMRARRFGRIVNIASIGGQLSVPHMSPYSTSKSALVGLSEGLRAELQADGIYVTTVCPGLMRTGSHLNAQFKGEQRAECGWFTAAATMPLVSMDADDAADQILRACAQGRSHLVLSIPAKVASLIHGIAPAMASETFALVNRALPRGSAGVSGRRPGSAMRPRLLPRLITALGDRAAERNNEVSSQEFTGTTERA